MNERAQRPYPVAQGPKPGTGIGTEVIKSTNRCRDRCQAAAAAGCGQEMHDEFQFYPQSYQQKAREITQSYGYGNLAAADLIFNLLKINHFIFEDLLGPVFPLWISAGATTTLCSTAGRRQATTIGGEGDIGRSNMAAVFGVPARRASTPAIRNLDSPAPHRTRGGTDRSPACAQSVRSGLGGRQIPASHR